MLLRGVSGAWPRPLRRNPLKTLFHLGRSRSENRSVPLPAGLPGESNIVSFFAVKKISVSFTSPIENFIFLAVGSIFLKNKTMAR